ncbi:probable LRR receptor-like serine/threonine-protein kinase At1g05700 [Momordica charantia]|uniref:non-specific serine/threonine protein kinase n=1 Tax=Momordica charantia TaxID=3673 RepID=A0A6J1CS29_MOMCH|nr:probable LRR receptor-like serine/threonine-protein kinase At1g05700 [Momordica charantia]
MPTPLENLMVVVRTPVNRSAWERRKNKRIGNGRQVSTSSTKFCLLLKAWLVFFWVLGILCNSRLAAGSNRHGGRKLATDSPAGFISIDCGATEDHTDNVTGILYKSDKDFVDTGISMPISANISKNLRPELKNVRSFPEGRRNCYVLSPEKGKDNTYLIRASFLYGNYDGKNNTPIFDLYLGANLWWTVDWDNGYVETLYTPSTDYISVCLFNTSKGVPYISALELRHLDSSIYQTPAKALVTMQRFDIGGKSNLRFPGDVYDRIWNPLNVDTLNSSSTNSTISQGNNDVYKIPNVLLQTAAKEQNATCSLSYFWETKPSNSQFYVYFHFAEVERLQGKRRRLKIDLTGQGNATTIASLDYLKPLSVSLNGTPDTAGQLQFSISAAEGSDLPPLLNGFEIYSAKEMQNASTVSEDADAMVGVKQTFRLIRNWQGDPCFPSDLLWDGLNCSNNSPTRIVSINLRSSKLVGEIPASIENLQSLTTLDLSDNELTGELPDFLVNLPNLKILNITRNKFTGSVPKALLLRAEAGSLALSVGENPDLCASLKCYNKWKKYLALIILSCIIAVLLPILVVALVIYKRRKQREDLRRSIEERLLKSKNRQVRYSEILLITDNLKTTIGEGGFGKVYLGILSDKTQVAIKLRSASSRQGPNEFRAEAQILTIVHHRNLVSLVGYCDEAENTALIYEFMANGNLRKYLSDSSTKVLSWIERLQIAVDAAQGLEYLHNGCKPTIIHRDMKTSNILLNERMQAKISDFGLSRVFANESDTHLSTCPAGTFGYVDPTIHLSGNFTKKSDVYSFGIVLFELLTAQPAIIKGAEYNIHIVDWAKPLIADGNIQKIVDPRLEGSIESCSAGKFAELALSCALPTSAERPDMSEVVSQLIECLKMAQDKTPQITPNDTDNFSYNSIGSESFLGPR